jgi:hypothetical protein
MSRLPFLLATTLAASSAFATPPAAPEVTVGAAHVKQLQFDFEIVPRSNYYELWFKANPNVAEVRFFESAPWRPTFTNNVSAHLLDWDQARYRVTACNPSGCSSSAPISVASLRKDVVGHFRSSAPRDGARFGQVMAVSEDGKTAAVLEPRDAEDRSSVSIYARTSADWRLQWRLRFSSQIVDGRVLSLSADGNTLAVGAPNEAQPGEDPESHGRVRIYQRTGTSWKIQAALQVPVAFDGNFGWQATLNDAGDTLLVGMNWNGVRMYTRANGTWTHTGQLPNLPSDIYAGISCTAPAFSGDGKAIARACYLGDVADETRLEVFTAPAWTRRDVITYPGLQSDDYVVPMTVSIDQTGDTVAFGFIEGGSGRHVDVLRRGTAGYQRTARLSPGAWHHESDDTPTRFGRLIELSSDAQILVVGDFIDTGSGSGSLKPPLAAGTVPTGAVYIFDRRGAGWGLRRVVKPNNPGPAGTYPEFGSVLALGDKGRVLLVADPSEQRNSGGFWLY